MSTVRDMTNRIISELNKANLADVTATVRTAISTAILKHQRKVWWFRQQRKNTNTIADQEYYALPDDFGKLDDLTITDGSIESSMHVHGLTMSNAGASPDNTGLPSRFTMYDNQLRLSPIPDDAYTLTMYYLTKYADEQITASASLSWTNDAEALIRLESEVNLCLTELQDAERAGHFAPLLREELAEMRRENGLRLMTGYTKKRKV